MKLFSRVSLSTALLVLMCLMHSWAWAAVSTDADPASLAVQGNESYRHGDFKRAVDLYREALEAGLANEHIHYNLANAYYRLGEYGKAIAHYRRALEQRPADPDIRANLALARKKAVDDLGDDWTSTFPLSPTKLLFLNKLISRRSLAVWTLTAYTLFWLCVAFWTSKTRPALRIATWFFLALTFLFGISAFGSRPGRNGEPVFSIFPFGISLRPAVVIAEQINVHSGNSDTFQVVFLLRKGAEIQVEEQRGEWIEVVLPKGRRGWAKIPDQIDIL